MSPTQQLTEGFFPSKAPSSDHKRCLTTFTHIQTPQAHTHKHTLLPASRLTTGDLKTQRGVGWLKGESHICHQNPSLSEGAGEVMNEPFITEASSLLMFSSIDKHLLCCHIRSGCQFEELFVRIYAFKVFDVLGFSLFKPQIHTCGQFSSEGFGVSSSSSPLEEVFSPFSHTPLRVIANVLANLQPKHIPFPFTAVSVSTSPLVCEPGDTRPMLD